MIDPNIIANTNGSTSVTIEDQIRNVDKVLKECENCRKSLEQICRRLDDLNDEVRRYREFLGYEKTRREPTLYKTTNSDHVTVHNNAICCTIINLTNQLTQEWLEKLKSIHNATSKSTPTK
ncbi:unnamed protein product [Thelazia callipaeda]|uniref:IF rod domain-containing protein n=1 Tax=Thelazia callipaeda TaxID=103827 RepID=A0A0N5CM70_THECL|nr:unnamed protein product [Thelazia callipaeda]